MLSLNLALVIGAIPTLLAMPLGLSPTANTTNAVSSGSHEASEVFFNSVDSGIQMLKTKYPNNFTDDDLAAVIFTQLYTGDPTRFDHLTRGSLEVKYDATDASQNLERFIANSYHFGVWNPKDGYRLNSLEPKTSHKLDWPMVKSSQLDAVSAWAALLADRRTPDVVINEVDLTIESDGGDPYYLFTWYPGPLFSLDAWRVRVLLNKTVRIIARPQAHGSPSNQSIAATS